MRLRSRRPVVDPQKRKNDEERCSRANRRSQLTRTKEPTPRKIITLACEVTVDACSPVGVDAGSPEVIDSVRREGVDPVCPGSDDEVPMATRRPRGRKRAIAVEDVGARGKEPGFTTPVRPLTQRCLSLMKPERSRPRSSASGSFYSPLSRFLTPSKENSSSPSEDRDIVMSPERFVFGYGAMGPLAGEEDAEDVFSPFTFIKNIPARSEQYKPSLRDIPPKMRSTPNGTLVLDLDETLLFSSLNVIENADCTFNTTFQDHQYKVYVVLRPHVKDFLKAMAKVYEMFVYTSAKKAYAEKLLDILDPQRKLFRHRLYQEHCTCVMGHYIKDLNMLERDPSKTVILDNAPHTYPYQLMNTVPIKSWSGEQDDRELQRLVHYMEKLSSAVDFRDVLKRRKDHIHRLLSED
ncbi:CTD small phosphatase-like protein 3 [Gadus macrocephalus]|uniref:CTD small phosphatase-like protein 3 n=1 Tax=Gadus macrocephalus TaxID=80720 RepID=UPI0028CB1A68|nr:CTD small phosphatase-like protein 3 [Gadus macrocephalus]